MIPPIWPDGKPLGACEDCGWVCESHPDRPWEGEHACTCGGAPSEHLYPRSTGFTAKSACEPWRAEGTHTYLVRYGAGS